MKYNHCIETVNIKFHLDNKCQERSAVSLIMFRAQHSKHNKSYWETDKQWQGPYGTGSTYSKY